MTAAPTTPAMPPVGAPPTPKSKLSGATLLVLVIVVVLILGGIGVLVAEAVKSDPTPTKPVGPAANPTGASAGAGRSARSTALRENTGSSSAKKKTKTVTSVKLAGGAATQPVPPGWTSKAGDNGNYVVVYKNGFFVYTEVAKSEAEATAQVSGMLQAWIVNDDHYSQVLVSDPNPLDAQAPLTSGANLGYNGLYTSNGGSSSVYGVLIAFVRSDGLVLRMQIEAFSATSTDDALARFKAEPDISTLVTVFDSFAKSAA
jgi:hypothetical protein